MVIHQCKCIIRLPWKQLFSAACKGRLYGEQRTRFLLQHWSTDTEPHWRQGGLDSSTSLSHHTRSPMAVVSPWGQGVPLLPCTQVSPLIAALCLGGKLALCHKHSQKEERQHRLRCLDLFCVPPTFSRSLPMKLWGNKQYLSRLYFYFLI